MQLSVGCCVAFCGALDASRPCDGPRERVMRLVWCPARTSGPGSCVFVCACVDVCGECGVACCCAPHRRSFLAQRPDGSLLLQPIECCTVVPMYCIMYIDG